MTIIDVGDPSVRARFLCDPREHLRSNLLSVMKSKDNIRPSGPGEDLVRTGFTLDAPTDAKQRGENTLCFR